MTDAPRAAAVRDDNPQPAPSSKTRIGLSAATADLTCAATACARTCAAGHKAAPYGSASAGSLWSQDSTASSINCSCQSSDASSTLMRKLG
eukprot:CAMPEP_0172674970 /NCGR_PEP_ID=MMETSP1074-20121228/13020_1 /TAXON_ID=2916 /ORGANISM="Ceratium fusus, Strain PA161109" /LENGTH=90 /DNA_ID=CAMNT_0013492413 /DNA_START=535 /DNA_END=807 /DNA_ORIENTATION=-